MKKLVTIMVVLAIATVANAGFTIGVNGVDNPANSTINLAEQQTATISIFGSGNDVASATDLWLVVQGPALTTGGALTVAAGVDTVLSSITNYDPTGMSDGGSGITSWMATLGLPGVVDAVDAVYVGNPGPVLNGSIVDQILFTCGGQGDVTLSLGYVTGDGTVWNSLDTQVIHQIPEPMTMSLLGLGALLIRRKMA